MRGLLAVILCAGVASAQPQQPVRVAASGPHLETADGKPFLLVADTCWTGPALSTEADWADYLRDRKAKGFTAVQFNLVSPWRAAPTDSEGRAAYALKGDQLTVNDAFFDKAEARLKAVVDAGMLPVPVLIWAHKNGDAGADLSEQNVIKLVTYELDRLGKYPALWILAGDNSYRGADGEKWKRVGRAAFAGRDLLVTTHPTGENFPWTRDGWAGEAWLERAVLPERPRRLGVVAEMAHGSGPATKYKGGKPVINLEPPYEGHNGYSTRKPHSALSTRRATYWSLLVTPTAGVTYGGHGVWSWHTRPGREPTDHGGTGVAKVWREAIDLPFASQIDTLRTVFGRIPWAELRPAQDLLASQPGDADPAKFVAVAATPDRSRVLIYSPAGAAGLAAVEPGRARRQAAHPRQPRHRTERADDPRAFASRRRQGRQPRRRRDPDRGGQVVTPLVGVIMGSRSDWATLEACADTLTRLGVAHEVEVVSAHRTPDRLFTYAESARGRGLEVIVAAAGGAAHLPGMCAAKTSLPVLGVPVATEHSHFRGLDALLSIVQMPAGVPVGTLAVGKAGAVNAALLAVAILANKYARTCASDWRRSAASRLRRCWPDPDPRVPA